MQKNKTLVEKEGEKMILSLNKMIINYNLFNLQHYIDKLYGKERNGVRWLRLGQVRSGGSETGGHKMCTNNTYQQCCLTMYTGCLPNNDR